MSTNLILGVDGGGTKTTALLADGDGRILGRGAAGSSNLHAAGESEALAALEAAIAAAYADAQRAPVPPDAACLGLAGAARAADQDRLRRWAAGALPSARVTLVTDADLVLAAGTPEGWGIAVISGTGSIAVGRGHDGRMARAGGWGWALGDEGSGYAIGLAALRAVARAADGRGPRTRLTEIVGAHWSLAGPDALIDAVYRSPYPRAAIAALAGLVEAAAEAGDEPALTIVRESGRELALAAISVVRALALDSPAPCALAGGVLVDGQWVRRAFVTAAAEASLRLEPIQIVAEPALGAVLLARRSLAGSESPSQTQ
jgi:N-acetylmuramic acid 6-phosphate etherase